MNTEMINLSDLKQKKIADLAALAKELNVEGAANMRRQELIFSILQAQAEKNGFIYDNFPARILCKKDVSLFYFNSSPLSRSQVRSIIYQ